MIQLVDEHRHLTWMSGEGGDDDRDDQDEHHEDDLHPGRRQWLRNVGGQCGGWWLTGWLQLLL